jgi:hypothetical protein
MKTFQRIAPVVAVVMALGGAIYYVQSNAPARPASVEVSKVPAPTQGTLPPSDRYANNASVGG